MTLTIHQLLVLAAVVEHGSSTQAAEALQLTQPAITFQVRQLEKEVGTALFFREGRTISATEAGFAAYRYALTYSERRTRFVANSGLSRQVSSSASWLALGRPTAPMCYQSYSPASSVVIPTFGYPWSKRPQQLPP